MNCNFRTPWFLPVLSGFFIGTSYIPFPPWASLFGFVPLWIFWAQQTRLKPVILSAVLATFVFTMIGFNWVTYLMHEFAHLPWLAAIGAMILFALIAHLFVPLAGVLWFLGRKYQLYEGRGSIFAMGLLTALMLWLLPMLFKWNFGYSWYGSEVPLYHIAEYIGFSGLSMLTILANVPLYFAWQQRDSKRGKTLLMRVVVAFLLLNVWGLNTKAWLQVPETSFNVLLVQANIGNAQKVAAQFGRGGYADIIHQYQMLTKAGLNEHKEQKVDFVVWSETAFPTVLSPKNSDNDNYYVQKLIKSIQANKVSLITGAYAKQATTGKITNSLFTIDAEGEVQPNYYSKSILLALGEYIPWEDEFPVLRELMPMVGSFGHGNGPNELLYLNDFKIGAQICYESLFPEFSTALADLGAQFIVNVTNDSWYGTWQEPYQHKVMTLARAVEIRRPLIRSTNTGISTVVLATGEVLAESPMQEQWYGLYTVPYSKEPKPTFYQQNIYLMPFTLAGILLLLLLLGIKGRKFNNSRA
ncbi:MAG: apolipoprotein N-acyltransferase [Methyloprofundus sp.]|nr:apolipoprotein N-acyltransferase [Methyloprofundus sp.]